MRLAVIAAALFLAAIGHAMTPPSSAANVPPRTSINSFNTPSGDGIGVSIISRLDERSSLESGAHSADNPAGEKATTYRTSLLLDYRVQPRATVILNAPHLYNRSSSSSFDQTTNGLGDLAAYGKYAFYQNRGYRPTAEISGIVGVKFPTGSTNARDSGGARLPVPQQPGSGTTDFVFGAAAVLGMPLASIYGDVSYKLNSHASYTFGDFIAANAGVSAPIPHAASLNLTGEINGEFAGRDRSTELTATEVGSDGIVRNTGSQTVYVSPGFSWRPIRDLALSFSVQLPIYQSVRGTQLAAGMNYNLGLYTRIGGG